MKIFRIPYIQFFVCPISIHTKLYIHMYKKQRCKELSCFEIHASGYMNSESIHVWMSAALVFVNHSFLAKDINFQSDFGAGSCPDRLDPDTCNVRED